jgi:hypothetical protein
MSLREKEDIAKKRKERKETLSRKRSLVEITFERSPNYKRYNFLYTITFILMLITIL